IRGLEQLSVANLKVVSHDRASLSGDVDVLSGSAGSVGFGYIDANGFVIGAVDGLAGIDTSSIAPDAGIALDAGGAVTQSPNCRILAPNLVLLGSGSYSLNDGANQVSTIAARTTGAVSYVDSDALVVGSVGGTSGVVTSNAPISISTINGDLTVTDT